MVRVIDLLCYFTQVPEISNFVDVFTVYPTRGMLYVPVLKSCISYFGEFSRYMNSYVSGSTTYSHF